MAQKDYNLGDDVTVIIGSPFGGTIDLGLVTDFKWSQEVETATVKPIAGPYPTLKKSSAAGWKVTFTVARTSSALDDLISQSEANYLATGEVPLTGYLQVFIDELGGSTSTYLMEALDFHLSDAGSWKRGKEVSMTLECFCATRRKLS